MTTMSAVQAYLAGKDSKGRQIRPPVVPEIATAYRNDPKTQLAVQAMANGTSGAPVAGGQYAYADGIARVLNAGMGGAMNRMQEQKYGTDQDTLLAQRAARGQDGMNGMAMPPAQGAPPPMPPAPTAGPPPDMSSQGSPMASQIAAALQGGQPPQGAPQPVAGGPSPIPGQPGGQPGGGNPFPVSSGSFDLSEGAKALTAGGAKITSGFRTVAHNKAVGGVANSFHTKGTPDNPQAYDFQPKPGESLDQLAARAKANFPGFDVIRESNHVHVEPSKKMVAAGPSTVAPAAAPVPNGLTRPVDAPVPDLPAPMARPSAPEAVAAVKSPLLTAAYKLMIDANPYESAAGQAMYKTGLSEQGDLNEAAAARQQGIVNAGYQTDLGTYASDVNARRSAEIAAHNATIAHNQSQQDEFNKYQQTSHEKDLDRKNALAVASTKAAGVGGDISDLQQELISQAIADKRLDPQSVRTKYQRQTIGAALEKKPDLDPIHLHALAVLDANPGAQQKANAYTILPEVVNNVREAGKKLKFSDAKIVGAIQAWGKGQLNDPDLTNYLSQRNDAVLKLANIMSGSGASDQRARMENDAAPKTMSPKAWDAWFKGQVTAVMPNVRLAEKKGLLEAGTSKQLEDSIKTYEEKPAAKKTGNPLVDKYL